MIAYTIDIQKSKLTNILFREFYQPEPCPSFKCSVYFHPVGYQMICKKSIWIRCYSSDLPFISSPFAFSDRDNNQNKNCQYTKEFHLPSTRFLIEVSMVKDKLLVMKANDGTFIKILSGMFPGKGR